MKNQTLIKVQKADVFTLLNVQGFNHAEFEWTDAESAHLNNTRISILIHRPTGYFFAFDFDSSNNISKFSPGIHQRVESHIEGRAWKSRRTYISLWAASLKEEIETIDPWDELTQSSELLSAASNETDNSLFTEDERQSISDGIKEIKEYLYRVHDLDPKAVESPMVYLQEASTRLGRKDWKAILISVLFSIIVDAYLPAETTREIFRHVFTILRPILIQQFLISEV